MTLDNRIFLDRTIGVGKLDAELALELGITGPILRACGVDHDLRRDAPFHAYDEVKVNVVTAQGGDCLARAAGAARRDARERPAGAGDGGRGARGQHQLAASR